MAEKIKAKKKLLKPDYASTIYFQVIGSGAPGAPRSLFLFTEHCRYLFNCGEGTQRLASEHKIKLSMTEHILITNKSWENIGGLLGTLLTLQDAGLTEITVHGPSNIETFYNDTKHFAQFINLNVGYKDYINKEKVIKDGPIEIEAIPLVSKVDLCNDEKESIIETSEVKDESELDHINKRRDFVLSYLCRAVPKPGALLPLRCQELGVPKGPLMGELKKGNDITLPNGNTVRAKDVTEPPDEGVNFIVVDIPGKLYLESLLKCEYFWKHQHLKGCSAEDVADVVVHFTPVDIVEEPSYQKWITDFGPSTSHVYINEKSTCMGSESVHKIQYKLNHLHSESFPILNDANIISNYTYEPEISNPSKRRKVDSQVNGKLEQSVVNEENIYKNGKIDDMCNHFQSFTCFIYHIRPPLKVDKSKRIKIDPEEYIKECYAVSDFASQFTEVRNRVENAKLGVSIEVKEQKYPYILFLGTGSCIPNKTRNTSGIALFINSQTTMLLDCGEGTYGQLVRHMGLKASNNFLRLLSIIYVSHLHADHHIGLIRILLARRRLLMENTDKEIPKLKLLAPKRIQHYLKSYDTYSERIFDQFTLLSNDLFMSGKNVDNEQNRLIFSNIGISDIRACFVRHCPHAFGLAFELENGIKIAYSGDTMPCPAFVEIGAGCDILIHEATMEDDLVEDARSKRHSTTSQAVETGNKMKAKYIILTHFSQRYAKVPLLDVVPENAIIAFDNMVIRLCDLPCLSYLYPAYKSMFSEDIDEILKKKAKRNSELKS